MTTRTEAGAEKSFVSTLLPWIIAGALAVIYLLTVNHWISFKNLQPVARATGQAWMPDVYAPVFVLMTSPFRWLPETSVPLALNLFSVVCAFFVLVLLARCVALVPHDRTQKQRERESGPFALFSRSGSWIPPVFAVLVCGLQLTFWENATTLSSGMFDLLVFAYAVRCLLEYRIDPRESWLLRAAVVYGAGCTDTWVMIGLSPFFLGAIIWIMGLGFFQLRFVSRLFLCVLAGLVFYLYLPLQHLRVDGLFWESLKQNLVAEFFQVELIARYSPFYVKILVALTSLLPVVVIGIRWKQSFGDTSELGVALTTWIFHLAHLALLGLCIWGAFDAGFGLRDTAGRFPVLSTNRDKLLPCYFLGALSIGYFSGYFLLVFRPLLRRGRRVVGAEKFLWLASTALVYVLLLLTPLGLLDKNLPAIRVTNGPTLENYAKMLTEKLPKSGVILSDGYGTLLLTKSWLARSGNTTNFLFLDARQMKSLAYYRFQTRQHPEQWTQVYTNLTRSDVELGSIQLVQVLRALAENHPIYYLHPSFGYYFEAFYPVPHGIVNELVPYPTNSVIAAPPLPETVFAENEAYWKEHAPEVNSLIAAVADAPRGKNLSFRQQWMTSLHIPQEKNPDSIQIGTVYSRALNVWGVDAQRLGRLDAAAVHFDQAVQLDPANLVATANLDFNRRLRKGDHVIVDTAAALQDRFGKLGNWERILNIYGIFDEPDGCTAQGIIFFKGGLMREASQNFLRSLELAPDSLLTQFWLARAYVILQMPEQALRLTDILNARSSSFADAAINPADVLHIELAANYVAGARDKAERLVNNILARKSPDPVQLGIAAQVATYYRDFSTALLVTDRQLQLSPDNINMLINKGYLNIQMTNHVEALPPLTKALSLESTNTTALYCRAVAFFEMGKTDESQRDYEALAKVNPRAFPAYHGLAEIALRKKDTNNAVRFYQLDLNNAPPNSPEWRLATERLKSLTAHSP